MTQSTTVHLTPDDQHTRPGLYAEFVATLWQERADAIIEAAIRALGGGER